MITFVMIADLPESGVAAFTDYEAHVLALLPRHGGRLERRLRSEDALTEVHVVSFDSREGYEGYIADPDRLAHRELLDGHDIRQRILQVTDV